MIDRKTLSIWALITETETETSYFSILQETETVKMQKIEELAFLADTETESSLKREAIQIYKKLSKKEYSDQIIVDLLKIVDDMVQEKKSSPNGGNSLNSRTKK